MIKKIKSLGIDSRHADQLVRGTLTLPHGTGKDVRIVVITDDENILCPICIRI